MRLTSLFSISSLLLLWCVSGAAGCEGCATEVGENDAGTGRFDVDGGSIVDASILEADAGFLDAGTRDSGSQVVFSDAGTPDEVDSGTAGPTPRDAGAPFNWQDLFGDAGVPEELQCLPGGLPEFSLGGLLELASFRTYRGTSEEGVVCGDDLCDPGVPCCELCGYALCAEPEADGSIGSCPFATRTIRCDGPEDCRDDDADTCCYSLTGTDCRPADDCGFDLPSFGGDAGLFPIPIDRPTGGIQQDGGIVFGFHSDAGDVFADAGTVAFDAGQDGGAGNVFADAGTVAFDAGQDGGAVVVDGGMSFVDAGFANVDAGMSLVDAGAGNTDFFADLLATGVPVCRRTLFPYSDCDVLSGELCCTSDRIVALDIGICLPALLCLGGGIP